MNLSRAFLDAIAFEDARGAFAALQDLEARLAACAVVDLEGADPRDVVRAMGARIAATDAADPVGALDALLPADIALAAAAARGDARALARFDRAFGAEMDRAIKKSPTLGLSTDEFRQIVREKLFVAAPGAAPRIASYAGRAPLVGWVRVTCARAVIDLARRSNDRESVPADDELLARLPDAHDPEVRLLRERFAPLLPSAFQAALEKLTVRQRNLLRQRYLHGVSASSLAQTYGVHRATLFTWIEEAREDLLRQVRIALQRTVKGTSVDSVIGVMGSELDLSIRRLLSSRLEDDA